MDIPSIVKERRTIRLDMIEPSKAGTLRVETRPDDVFVSRFLHFDRVQRPPAQNQDGKHLGHVTALDLTRSSAVITFGFRALDVSGVVGHLKLTADQKQCAFRRFVVTLSNRI